MGSHIGHVLESLGWALLHSLWQCSAILMAVIVFRLIAKRSTPALRYNIQFTGLIVCLIAFALTFIFYFQSGSQNISLIAVLAPDAMVQTAASAGGEEINLTLSTSTAFIEQLSRSAPVLGILWCLGFVFMTVRYAAAYILTQKLRKTGRHLPPAQWQHRFRTLVLNTGLSEKIRLYVSDYVNGPLTIGFLKPVVLVPASFLTHLPQDQIKAILLHELAHIRRYDYLVNLIQNAIKTIFFFHPAVHYLAAQMDLDREKACDDFAVTQTQNPKALALGLAALKLHIPQNNFAMAAAPDDMPLLARLTRLTGSRETARRPEHILMSALSALLISGIYVSSTVVADAHPENDVNSTPTLAGAPTAASHPNVRKHNYTFKTFAHNGGTYTAKIAEDGSRWVKKDAVWMNVDQHPNILDQLSASMPVPPTPLNFEVNSTLNNSPHYTNKVTQYEIDMEYYQADMQRYMEMSGDRGEREIERALEQAEEKRERDLERAEEKRERALERAEEKREQAMERAEETRERAIERAERNREHSVEKTKLEEEKTNHEAFRSRLLDMLVEDGIIRSRNAKVKIKYPGNVTTVNGIDVETGFGGKYCRLWDDYGLEKSEQSYMKISPTSFEIKTELDDGRSDTHVTYGQWDDARLTLPAPPLPPQAPARHSHHDVIPAHHAVTGKLPVFIMPITELRISAHYGNSHNSSAKFHKGIDFSAPTGTPVYASADGTIHLVTTEQKWGHRIIIKHKDGFQTLYAHLDGFAVERGQSIKAGELIGFVGSTGQSTGAHLHFEIHKNGHTINPEAII